MGHIDMVSISSERLDLFLLSQEALQFSLTCNAESVERILRLSVPSQWYAYSDLIQLRLNQLTADPDYLLWGLRAIVLRNRQIMVGFINCHSKPGAPYLHPFSLYGVEFGFEIFLPFRRQGYAQEACRALMQWAYHCQRVPEFILSIRPDNLPSRRLAEHLGFTRVGSHIDDIDGPEDVFKLVYQPTDAA